MCIEQVAQCITDPSRVVVLDGHDFDRRSTFFVELASKFFDFGGKQAVEK